MSEQKGMVRGQCGIFRFLLVFVLIQFTLCQTPIWSIDSNLVANHASLVVSTLRNSASAPVSYPIAYSIAGASSSIAAAVSPDSLNFPNTNDMSFTIGKALSSTTLTITLTLFASSILYSFDVYYIIMDVTNVYRLITATLTSKILNQGVGYRSENLTLTTSNSIFFGAINLTSIIVIESFKMSNLNGTLCTLQAFTNVQSDLSILNTFVTSDNNNITEIVFSVIFYAQSSAYLTMRQIYVLGSFAVSPSNASSTSLLTLLPARYQISTTQSFFGLNQFNFTRSGDKLFGYNTGTQRFLMSNTFNQITLQYLFFVWRGCTAGTYFYKDYSNAANDYCSATCPADRPYQDTTNLVCAGCDYTCLTCGAVGNTQCTTCDSANSFRTPSSASSRFQCPCMSTYIDVGVPVCSLCYSFIPGCSTCTSNTVCTLCKSGMTLSSPTLCTCTTGFLLNNICSTTWGCTSISLISGSPICTACDSSQFFIIVQANYTCACITGTILTQITPNNWTCKEKCGDKYVMPTQNCDDGNNINGDGCSSTCTVQQDYLCVGALAQGSTCKLELLFNFIGVGVERDTTSNSALFFILVTPPNLYLSMIDLSSIFTTNIPHSSISASYDLSQNLIKITVDYTQSIQFYNTTFSFALSQTKYFWNDSSTTHTIISGTNCELSYNDHFGLMAILNYIVLGLVCSVFITLIVSIFFEKWIGLQLIQTYQAVYFCFSLFQKFPFQFTPFYEWLIYANGFNKLIPHNFLRVYSLSATLQALGIEKQFLSNFNVMGLLIVAVMITLGVIRIIKNRLTNQLQERVSRALLQKQKQIQQVSNFLFFKVYMMMVFLCMFKVFFAFSVQMSNQQQALRVFPEVADLILAIVSFIVLFSTVSFLLYWYLLLPKNFNEEQQFMGLSFLNMKFYYPILYIFYQLILICTISIIYKSYWAAQIVISFQSVYLILLIYLRPYHTQKRLHTFLHNFTIIFNQLVTMVISALSIFYNSKAFVADSVSDLTMNVLMVMLLILLMACLGLAIARLAIFNRDVRCCQCLKKKETQEDEEEDKIKQTFQKNGKRTEKDQSMKLLKTEEAANLGERKIESDEKKRVARPVRPQRKQSEGEIEYNERFKQFFTDKHIIWRNNEESQRQAIAQPNKRLAVVTNKKTAMSRRSAVQEFVELQSRKLAQMNTKKFQQAQKVPKMI